MSKVRIKLNSTDIEMLNNICNSVRDIAKRSGITVSGPVPLPTKRLKVTTRKSPCGDGTATFDNYEMRVHKRLIDLPANEKVLHHIMKMQIPKSVNIKIQMLEWFVLKIFYSKTSWRILAFSFISIPWGFWTMSVNSGCPLYPFPKKQGIIKAPVSKKQARE